jgi:deoxyribodipyrimidine photolyase-related protein
MNGATRGLVLLFADQLDRDAAWRDYFDPARDAVLMIEPGAELRSLGAHKQKIAVSLAAMRAFRDELGSEGVSVHYRAPGRVDAGDAAGGTAPEGQAVSAGVSAPREGALESELARALEALQPTELRVVRPGSWHTRERVRRTAAAYHTPLAELEDRHFFDSPERFSREESGRSTPVLERYYRRMRVRHGVLVTETGEPVGGAWNFDKENRQSFGQSGPGEVPEPIRFAEDALRSVVAQEVAEHYRDHPGRIDLTATPITPTEARTALEAFVNDRLAHFGPFQDALWTGHDLLYHSGLSVALNMKLLSPKDAVEAACTAYEKGTAPLSSVEGFVRQILGWREYVRGLYWSSMPAYAELNALDAHEPLPPLYWSGETEMQCLREAMGNVLRNGYAHHIQRLMVLGLFSMLYGASPQEFNSWHVAMYIDGYDWASAPNAIGMSQWADGGIVGTKPYTASGNYINKMSNYCRHCRFNPKQATGESACPFTTLYWTFLERHGGQFADNRRMQFQLANLRRKSAEELEQIRAREAFVRQEIAAGRL